MGQLLIHRLAIVMGVGAALSAASPSGHAAGDMAAGRDKAKMCRA